MTNNLTGKHFYVHAQALDNRAVLRITDKRTMKTHEFELDYDGEKPYFVEEQEAPEVEQDTPEEE